MATGSEAEALLWDTTTFKNPRTIPAAAGWLEFTPAGDTLLTAARLLPKGQDHVVRRWEVATGKPLGESTLPTGGGWQAYALGADGKDLFAVRDDPPEPFVHVYDATTGEERRTAGDSCGRAGARYGG